MFKKIALAVCMLAAPVLPSWAQPKYEVSQVLTTSSFAFLPVYVAEHMGYFGEEGVALKTVMAATAQAGLAMVAGGSAEYYLSTPVAAARSAAQGARMLNCGALMTQNPTNIVVSAAVAKKHNIGDLSALSMNQRIALLKGLRVAAHTSGSSPDQTLKFMLTQAGLSPERDVQILPITQGAILAALERDRIDAFAYSSPLADAAVLRYGAVKLISLASGEYKPLAGQLSISMVCNQDWVEKQPDAAAAVLRALWRGMKLLRNDPMAARAAARKAFPDLDEATFNAAFETNRAAFPDNPAISRQQMENALDFHSKTGGTPIVIKVEATYTNSAVERAAKGMRQPQAPSPSMQIQASGMIDVRVERVRTEARGIKSFELVAVGGASLPRYGPGAHIDVALADRLVRSYSLIGPLNDYSRYRIAVNLDPRSRGGSSWLHSAVAAGDLLRISEPRNHFPLVEDVPASILIAGGIGITPIWCMVQRLQALNQPWELHYACRSRQAAAFLDELTAAAGAAQGAGHLHLWFDEEHQGNTLDIATIVKTAPIEAHLYCCGPSPMLGSFRESAAGESSDRIHLEYFRPAEIAKPACGFVVELARSGVSVEVPAGSSILDALIMRGIDAPYSCYEGLCGTCETRVLEGIPDHKDNLLSEKAKAENKTVLICCSGSKTKRLVLDL